MCVCLFVTPQQQQLPCCDNTRPTLDPTPHTTTIYIYISLYIYISHTLSLPKRRTQKATFSHPQHVMIPIHTHFSFGSSRTQNERHTPLSLSLHTHTHCVLRTVWREGGRDRRNRRLDDSSRACALASVRPPEGNDKHQPKTPTTQQHKVYLNHNQLYI